VKVCLLSGTVGAGLLAICTGLVDVAAGAIVPAVAVVAVAAAAAVSVGVPASAVVVAAAVLGSGAVVGSAALDSATSDSANAPTESAAARRAQGDIVKG
jgi:hypothetical protein